MADSKTEDYYIQEFIHDRPGRIWVVRNPAHSAPGYYRCAVSIDAFRRHNYKTWYEKFYTKGKIAPRRFSVKDRHDYETSQRLLRESMERTKVDLQTEFDKVPPIEAGTVFDFYGLVEYNPRRRSFLVPKGYDIQSLS